MKLYEVQNGFIGNGAVHVLVLAASAEQAKDLASGVLSREANKRLSMFGRDHAYPSAYWEVAGLKVTVLVEATDMSWASGVRD